MYRRELFISVTPLLGNGALRASCGCFLAILATSFAREMCPFINETTNMLSVVAHYQILGTFLAALVLISESLTVFGMSDFAMGSMLLFVNCFVVLLAGYWCYLRWLSEKEREQWRQPLSDEELALANVVLDGINHGAAKESEECSEGGTGAQSVLAPYLLNPRSIELRQRIGAGSFGEVFKAIYSKEVVAVKTVRTVSEASMKAFKAEILLTASLRHGNIVNFLGACFDPSFVCLVLEWVPRGSLSDFLGQEETPGTNSSLQWADPLLKLVTDVARGMAYLHGREVPFGGAGGGGGGLERQIPQARCSVIHRDLKPVRDRAAA